MSSLFLQSKYKENISATRPIFLDKLKLEVCLSLFLYSFLACVPIAMRHCVPCFLSLLFFSYIYASPLITCSSPSYIFILFHVLQLEPEPISIYHPMTNEVCAAMGTPMEGFFDEANVVADAMTSTALTTAQGVPTETSTFSTESVPVDEDT